MTRMAKFIVVTSLVFSCLVNATEADLIGFWSAVNLTKGGLGSQWTFTPNGSATHTFGAAVDFLYETDGNKMKMTFVNPDGTAAPDTPLQEFVVKGDTLTLNPDNTERRQEMRRTGALIATSPLVGEWTYKHHTGVPAFMRYSPKGNGQLVVPMKSAQGTYQTENGKGQIKLGVEQLSLVIQNNDSLLVRDAQGKESTYKRFK